MSRVHDFSQLFGKITSQIRLCILFVQSIKLTYFNVLGNQQWKESSFFSFQCTEKTNKFF